MSWKSDELEVVGWGDGSLWSVIDAAWLLDVPERTVRDAVRRAALEAAGKRRYWTRGTRHVRVYRADEVAEALGLKNL
jgi:hypothetical protein